MKQVNNSSSGGVGFLGLLAIVFITLKLIGTITWSWWAVTAPLWGGVALAFGILLLWFMGLIIEGVVKKIRGT